MKDIFKGEFYNPTKGKISSEDVSREIISYIQEEPEREYSIVVGCDSSSRENLCFPVAVVVLRKGRGGRFFLKKIRPSALSRKIYSWKERVLEEVFLSCRMALVMKEKIEKEVEASGTSFNYEFQYIHADVGTKGRTRDMIKEVISLIEGNGFKPKIKPESFVATVVADRFT